MKTYNLLIAGASPSNESYVVKSPYSGKDLASVARADDAAIEQALKNAHESFHEEMLSMPAHQRAAILYKVARLIEGNHEELSLLIAHEGGKPLKDARVEVTRAMNTTKMSGDEALQLNGETLTMDRSPGTENCLAYTIRVPVGPVLAISAFNHPVNLICHQVCTAFAAGNSVVVKPASQTPLSCHRILELFREAGAPEKALSLAAVSGSKGDVLVQDSRIRFITFIGGEDVGWEIRKKAQPGVRIALEHGGTGTAIVDKDVDLSNALPSITRGAFYHAGQVCVSTQIVHVHESLYEKVVHDLAERARQLVVGDPADPKTDVGPLISRKDVERVDEWVREAVSQGAKLICGGEKVGETCYAPTILADTTPNMKVSCKEIFGPVLCLTPYSDIQSVITEMNDSPYSFQSAIYTNNITLAHKAARQIETKAFMINESTAFRVDWMPFGGAKRSGLGVGGTRHAVHDMTEEKLVVVRLP